MAIGSSSQLKKPNRVAEGEAEFQPYHSSLARIQSEKKMLMQLQGTEIDASDSVSPSTSQGRKMPHETKGVRGQQTIDGSEVAEQIAGLNDEKFTRKFKFERAQYHQCIPNPAKEKEFITVQLVSPNLKEADFDKNESINEIAEKKPVT